VKLPHLLQLLLEEFRRERNWRRIRTIRTVGGVDHQSDRSWERHPDQPWRHQPTARNLSR